MGQTLRRVLEWDEEEEGQECQTAFDFRYRDEHGSEFQKPTHAVAVAGRILRQHGRDFTSFYRKNPTKFPNLTDLPPELSILVLSHLDATDLCLAACVWQQLATDEILWAGLCKSTWHYASVYAHMRHDGVDGPSGPSPCSGSGLTYRRLYLLLDEASLTFNADPELGISYLLRHHLVDDDASEIARFFNGTSKLHKQQRKTYLEKHHEVLKRLVQLQDFNGFLPNRLREFFSRICHAPNARNEYLTTLIDQFSNRFTTCNSNLGLNKDTIFILCYSLIMLSVDLASPHVKNKMSKREFIRNLRHATPDVNDEYTGHLYDNVYLIGHVIPQPVN